MLHTRTRLYSSSSVGVHTRHVRLAPRLQLLSFPWTQSRARQPNILSFTAQLGALPHHHPHHHLFCSHYSILPHLLLPRKRSTIASQSLSQLHTLSLFIGKSSLLFLHCRISTGQEKRKIIIIPTLYSLNILPPFLLLSSPTTLA